MNNPELLSESLADPHAKGSQSKLVANQFNKHVSIKR